MGIQRKARVKRSLVWTISTEDLQEIVKNSCSIADVLRSLGYGSTGATSSFLKERLIKDKIDFCHIKLGLGSNRGRKFLYTLEESLVNIFNDTKLNNGTSILKKYILVYDLLKYQCKQCENTGTWQDKKLVLQLDHIDGNKYNNKLDNLRFLCPNCHTQTDTYGTKNHKVKNSEVKKFYCLECSKEITSGAITNLCQSCANISRGNIDRLMDKENVKRLVWEKPMSQLANDFNCSQNGLKKYCLRHGIDFPSQGYWTRRNHGYSHEEALNPVRKQSTPRSDILQSEVDEIKKLLDAGISISKIYSRHKRCKKVIRKIKNGTYKVIPQLVS